MVDISSVATVSPGRYCLDRVKVGEINEELRQFVQCLIDSRAVLYDWGKHHLHACRVPFTVDYKKSTIVPGGKSDWCACDPDDLHEGIKPAFEGQWGPTSVDTILRLERSGIRVSLCGSQRYFPKDPELFMEELRKSLIT